MTLLVAIETSTDLASVALLYHNDLSVLTATGSATHSFSILPMIQQLLRAADVTLAACDAIAFGAGPGSFTGVRTACGVAQGLAFGADIPVVAINTLEAMALACHEATGAQRVLPVLDARMGEVYWAQYDFSNGLAITLAPSLSAPAMVVPSGPVTACGNGVNVLSTQATNSDLLHDARADIMPNAAQIAELARRALKSGLQVHARDAQPIYLRNQVALTTAERVQKKLQEAV